MLTIATVEFTAALGVNTNNSDLTLTCRDTQSALGLFLMDP